MADLFQWFGNDLETDVYGSLKTVSGSTWTQQRIVRRLLTNPGSYLNHPDYGAGLGRFIGENLSQDIFNEVTNLIVTQMLKEESVAKQPKIKVNLNIITVLSQQYLSVSIEYFDLIDQQTAFLSFTVE